ncbi:MAG: bifunctional oligoribonuclease/PAP phosphatase NrnA [Spirochaetaceae bacterium]|jgi:phosphoesterase RecJ-like protein|nr:bifunctional oligoribonuclease/PAP phosphatase NrnA [Spirochaetaceae bacterium]
MNVPEALIEFIKSGTEFIVAGHKEPDGDCVGSQLAITSLLRRLGKKAFPCSAGPFKRIEVKPYEDRFLPCPAAAKGMRVLVMDCTNRERVGDLPIDGMPVASVDHHATQNPWGEAVFLDPEAPSVTFLTEKIFRALDMEILPEEAELLFLGLCTDTGFFRHLDGGEYCQAVLETAARLCGAGASPKKTFAAIYGGKSLNSRLLMGAMLAKTHSYYNGRLLISNETLEETKRYGLESRDSDMTYQLLQSIKGVEAMVLIRQETQEECTIGFRSRDHVDVAAIAKDFGGGGHKNAAGTKIRGTIPEMEERIAAAFASCFNI